MFFCHAMYVVSVGYISMLCTYSAVAIQGHMKPSLRQKHKQVNASNKIYMEVFIGPIYSCSQLGKVL